MERLGQSCFQESGLTKVEIPAKVKVLEQHTFNSCSSLKTVSLPDGLQVISEGCFYSCGLKELVIPQNVTTIKNSSGT